MIVFLLSLGRVVHFRFLYLHVEQNIKQVLLIVTRNATGALR